MIQYKGNLGLTIIAINTDSRAKKKPLQLNARAILKVGGLDPYG